MQVEIQHKKLIAFYGDESNKLIEQREVDGFPFPRDVVMPEGAIRFCFYEQFNAETPDGIELASRPLNVSPMYFPGGIEMTLADVESRYQDRPDILTQLAFMHAAGVAPKTLVCTTSGALVFFESDIPGQKAECI